MRGKAGVNKLVANIWEKSLGENWGQKEGDTTNCYKAHFMESPM